MINQFNDYVVLDSMHINGKATLGENLADLGGLVIGYDAFKKTEQYKEGRVKFLESLLDKYTHNTENLLKLIDWVKKNNGRGIPPRPDPFYLLNSGFLLV